MKKKFLIVLSLVFLSTACSNEESNTKNTNEVKDTYEQITNKYSQGKATDGSKTTFGLGKWFRRIGRADAIGAGTYVLQNGTNSNFLGGLISGGLASLTEIFKEQIVIDKPFDDIMLLKTVEFQSNYMDLYGYNHYVIVNEVLKDPTTKDIPQADLYTSLYDKVYTQALILDPNTPHEKTKVITLLEEIDSYPDNQSDTFFKEMYKFGNSTDFDNYTKISKLYSSVYSSIDNVTAFTTYSTEMEQAVLTDKSLSTEVKNVLLMEMATYRYGFYYYSQIN